MPSIKEIREFQGAILRTPGMNKELKITLKLPCKAVLYLSKIIEFGLAVKDQHEEAGILQVMDDVSLEKLKSISGEIVHIAELSDTYEDLKRFNGKS